MVQKKLSSPISKKTGVWGGVLKNDLQLVYKWGWCKTFIPSPISIKMAVWYPCFGKCSPIVYSCSHLISRGKPKVHPLQKTFLTYMNKNGLLNTLFWKIFTVCLQMPSLNSHRKPQTAPPSEKISLTYMYEKAVLGIMFQYVFTSCLQISPHL